MDAKNPGQSKLVAEECDRMANRMIAEANTKAARQAASARAAAKAEADVKAVREAAEAKAAAAAEELLAEEEKDKGMKEQVAKNKAGNAKGKGKKGKGKGKRS